MSKAKGLVWLAVFMLIVAGISPAIAAETTTETETATWNVSVGKATDDGVSIDSMFPKVLYVHQGDEVVFTNESAFAPHTVTFLAGSDPLSPQNPANLAPHASQEVNWDGATLLNSGIMHPTGQFTVTFDEIGAFPYYCILHPLMQGTVVVLPKGASIPTAQMQMHDAVQFENDLIDQANALRKAKEGFTYTKNEDGSFTYEVEMGVGLNGFTVNKMLPETLVVSEGDTVEWTNDNHYEMHFVTFNKPDDMHFFLPNMDLNPAFFPPAGGPEFDGEGFVNSGVAMPHQNFKLKFTKPGTYKYECYLHSGDKMVGTVVVVPENTVKVQVNGKALPVIAEKRPHIHNGHVFVSMVEFAEVLGGKAGYNHKNSAVEINVDGFYDFPEELVRTEGYEVVINGEQLLYDYNPKPHAHAGRSYAPIREMVTLLGGSYTYDSAINSFVATIPQFNNVEVADEHARHMDMGHAGHEEHGKTTTEEIVVINMDDMKYEDTEVTVKVGTKVKWVNNESVPHSVTELNYAFDSGTMNKGDEWSFTFNEVGSFDYYCTFHPQMVGKIIVEE